MTVLGMGLVFALLALLWGLLTLVLRLDAAPAAAAAPAGGSAPAAEPAGDATGAGPAAEVAVQGMDAGRWSPPSPSRC